MWSCCVCPSLAFPVCPVSGFGGPWTVQLTSPVRSNDLNFTLTKFFVPEFPLFFRHLNEPGQQQALTASPQQTCSDSAWLAQQGLVGSIDAALRHGEFNSGLAADTRAPEIATAGVAGA